VQTRSGYEIDDDPFGWKQQESSQMEVLGVEREMVYPCVPGPLKLLELSNNDQVMPRTYAEFLFFFSGEKRQKEEEEEEEEEDHHHHHHHHGVMSFMDSTQLKLSLSKTLSEFYVLAGRLKKRPNGGVDVDCNNMGVVFVEARTHSSLDHLDGFQPHPSFRLLVADAEVQFGDKDFSEMPLLLAQVSE